MRWSSLMAWMSVVRCNVFYGNDASPLPETTKPPSALWLHLSAEKWLLTAPLRGEKIFSFPSTPSHPLRSFIFTRQPRLFIVAFFRRGDASGLNLSLWWGLGRFESTLMQLHASRVCAGDQKLWPGTMHAVCRSLRPPYNQAADLTSIKGVSHLFDGETVRLCIRLSQYIGCMRYSCRFS